MNFEKKGDSEGAGKINGKLANVFGDYFSDQIYLLPSLLRQSITKKKIDITIKYMYKY